MMLLLPAICLTLACAISAATIEQRSTPSQGYTPANADCVDYEIPVDISTQGYSFVPPEWTDNYGLVDFVTNAASRVAANGSSPLKPGVSLEGNYTVAATFCSPKNKNSTANTVLVLTHGGGYDSRYWNSEYEPETYNFVQFAVSQGYSVFNYDRVGVGKSSKLSGFVSQSAIHVQVLTELASQIKTGKYTGGAPTKVVLVGHSMGSFFSNGVLVNSPEVADAGIFTGLAFAENDPVLVEAFNVHIAAGVKNIWSDLDPGFVIWLDVYANVNAFFKAPTYAVPAAEYAETVKAPVGMMELLTLGTTPLNATNFKGPALVINGEYDFVTCGGYCPGVIEANAAHFPNSVDFRTKLNAGEGHGVNFHLGAPETYANITNFLKEHGI